MFLPLFFTRYVLANADSYMEIGASILERDKGMMDQLQLIWAPPHQPMQKESQTICIVD